MTNQGRVFKFCQSLTLVTWHIFYKITNLSAPTSEPTRAYQAKIICRLYFSYTLPSNHFKGLTLMYAVYLIRHIARKWKWIPGPSAIGSESIKPRVSVLHSGLKREWYLAYLKFTFFLKIILNLFKNSILCNVLVQMLQ